MNIYLLITLYVYIKLKSFLLSDIYFSFNLCHE